MRRFLLAVVIVLTLVGTVVLAATLIAAHDPARAMSMYAESPLKPVTSSFAASDGWIRSPVS